MDASIDATTLRSLLKSKQPPLVIDVRRNERFLESSYLLKGALRRDPAALEEWKATLPCAPSVVVYCVHGHEVSQGVARSLGARYLEGGIEHWKEEGGELSAKPANAPTRWVTRERPKIDRIACPWVIRRFIDPGAEFLYVTNAEVRKVARERTAIAYDIAEVEFSHAGERCSFDAFLERFRLEEDAALRTLALIVRGADTNRMALAPEAAGLAAISLGLSINYKDDHLMLEQGMLVYDALYAWCRQAKAR